MMNIWAFLVFYGYIMGGVSKYESFSFKSLKKTPLPVVLLHCMATSKLDL